MEDYTVREIIPNKNNDIIYERNYLMRFKIKQLIIILLICNNCCNKWINITKNNTLYNI